MSANRDHNVDSQTYNPGGNPGLDKAGFDDITNPELVSVAPRGGRNQPTGVNAALEDREAEQSDISGRIPKREVDSLLSEVRPDERNIQGKTRGNKVDAWKQERALDQALSGVENADQDVEISAADGRRGL